LHVVGVDIGGTFTDLVLYDTESTDVHVHKVPSTPATPEQAMVDGLRELCAAAGVAPADVRGIFHGTTVATNSVLEHDGARVGLITTRGFRDVLHIGRHQRPLHYSVMQDIPWQAKPFALRRHRYVVTERIVPPTGEVLVPLAEDEVRAAAHAFKKEGLDAVAVCFLFSYLNPEHERRAAEIVHEELPDAFVTTSAEIVPQFREFERFTTAAMSAFVGPKTARYLERLADALVGANAGDDLHVMMSSGGVASAKAAAARPVTLLMSGPAAGVLGGRWAGALEKKDRLITFDMGGTSADIGIVTEAGIAEASARDTWIGGYPLLVPMLDVHAIGAGGGSIAYVDEGGAFRVGPRSAGAVPGPACYGLGGAEPTISDAHMVLGRLDPDHFLGGRMQLDKTAAVDVVQQLARTLSLGLAEAAEGVLTIANSNMARAIRSRTIERGHDPRDFALVAFGGAGPLHAAELADSLDIPEVIIPPHPGITSAAGLLTSDLKYDQMRTVFQMQGSVQADRLNAELDSLATELRGWLRRDGVGDDEIEIVRAIDCRYVGQGYELRVTLDGPYQDDALERFHELHRQEYGAAYGDPIEIVNARVTAIGRRPALRAVSVAGRTLADSLVRESSSQFRTNGALRTFPTPYLDRSRLPIEESFAGPAIVLHADTTTVVPPGWNAMAHSSGNLILKKGEIA
jgi:N-methylhydantoinase A